jgi:hypothetical protein
MKADKTLEGKVFRSLLQQRKFPMQGTSMNASSMAGSESVNHCCRKWLRDMAYKENRGSPCGLRSCTVRWAQPTRSRHDLVHLLKENTLASFLLVQLQVQVQDGLLYGQITPSHTIFLATDQEVCRAFFAIKIAAFNYFLIINANVERWTTAVKFSA